MKEKKYTILVPFRKERNKRRKSPSRKEIAFKERNHFQGKKSFSKKEITFKEGNHFHPHVHYVVIHESYAAQEWSDRTVAEHACSKM